MSPTPPSRQIRADYDERTIVVYQAYNRAIAHAALDAQTFVPPFRMQRMTWIKPSFLWMMYRSGWATKPHQECVLRIRLHRHGFDWALDHACLSSAKEARIADEEWGEYRAKHCVRVQWDPERDLRLERLRYRSIQIGLSQRATELYVNDWIVGIDDITPLVHSLHESVQAGEGEAAARRLPIERPYPASSSWIDRLRMSEDDGAG